MVGESDRGLSQSDEIRRLVPLFALVVAVVTALVRAPAAPDLVFAAIPVAAFGLWAVIRSMPLLVLSLAVVVPVVIAQRVAARVQADESKMYACGGGTSLHVYPSSAHAGQATATLATWHVADPATPLRWRSRAPVHNAGRA